MEPKRLRFSDLSSSDSNSSTRSSHSRRSSSNTANTDLVQRLSTSFTTISTTSIPSTKGHRESNNDFQVPLPVTTAPPSVSRNPSRQSFATTASGTSVWTVHGSRRTTMSIATTNAGKTTSPTSTENTETLGNYCRDQGRRDVMVSGIEGNPKERCVTPSNDDAPSPYSDKRPVAIADDTDELPPTQPSGPLKGVVAYVEVYSGAENRSSVVGSVLRDLGAMVSQRFTNKVTHVIYRDGRQSTLERARLRNVYLVTVLWVDTCQRENRKASESEYAVPRRDHGTPQTLRRARRVRSMQPKPQEAELALTDDCMKKRKQRLEAARLKREIIKDIREGRLVGTASKNQSNAENESIQLVFDNHSSLRRPFELTLDDNETPALSQRDTTGVQKKVFGTGDTPHSRYSQSQQSQQSDTLGDSVRRKLFDVGGLLHGTPVPTFLTRSRSTARSKRVQDDCNILESTEQSGAPRRYLSEVNASYTNPAAGSGNKDGEGSSTIDEVITMVCENVGRLNIAGNKPASTTKRRIFDPSSDRISDRMEPANEKRGEPAVVPASDVGQAFGLKKENSTARRSPKVHRESMVRLRSSLFLAETSSEFVRQLQMGRRSSEDFVNPMASKKTANNKAMRKAPAVGKKTIVKRKREKKIMPTNSLAMTSVKFDDREVVCSIAKRMKAFRIVSKVDIDTTHIICGENRRTLNVLLAVARGCWILPVEWVYRSLAHGQWLPEEDFELVDIFPAAKAVRQRKLARQQTEDLLFRSLGPIYVGPTSKPPMADMRMLIEWCGGRIASTSRRAKFCIGCKVSHENVTCVKETWILDSIMEQRVLPVDEYLLH